MYHVSLSLPCDSPFCWAPLDCATTIVLSAVRAGVWSGRCSWVRLGACVGSEERPLLDSERLRLFEGWGWAGAWGSAGAGVAGAARSNPWVGQLSRWVGELTEAEAGVVGGAAAVAVVASEAVAEAVSVAGAATGSGAEAVMVGSTAEATAAAAIAAAASGAGSVAASGAESGAGSGAGAATGSGAVVGAGVGAGAAADLADGSRAARAWRVDSLREGSAAGSAAGSATGAETGAMGAAGAACVGEERSTAGAGAGVAGGVVASILGCSSALPLPLRVAVAGGVMEAGFDAGLGDEPLSAVKPDMVSEVLGLLDEVRAALVVMMTCAWSPMR